MQDLGGKTAVVTGGGGGLGRAMGERFAREGMIVVLADVQAAPLDFEAQLRKSTLAEPVLVVPPGFEAALQRGELDVDG